MVNDAGGRGVNEAGDAVGAAAFENRAGAEDVGAEKIAVAAPDADFGGGVENGGVAGAGGADGGGVVEGGGDEADAAGGERGVGVAREDGDGAASGEKAFDEAAAEEAGAAGDEDGRGGVRMRRGSKAA